MENHVGRQDEADREGLERLRAWRAILRQLLREAGVAHSDAAAALLNYLRDPRADVTGVFRGAFLRPPTASSLGELSAPPGVYHAVGLAIAAGLAPDMVLATVVAVWPGGYEPRTMELHTGPALSRLSWAKDQAG